MWHGPSLVRGVAVVVVGGIALGCILTHQAGVIGGALLAVTGAVAVFLKGDSGGDDAPKP